MHLLERADRTSVFAFLLNKEGRILHDLIIYKVRASENDFLVESDSATLTDLCKLLLKYKMRKRIDLVNCQNTLKVCACFEAASDAEKPTDSLTSILDVHKSEMESAYAIDPRLPQLGSRLVVSADDDISYIFDSLPQTTQGDPYS